MNYDVIFKDVNKRKGERGISHAEQRRQSQSFYGPSVFTFPSTNQRSGLAEIVIVPREFSKQHIQKQTLQKSLLFL